MVQLNRFSSVPLYTQLSQQIKDKILSETIKPGNPLPTESEMAKIAGVSSAVVRQAYSYLRRAGFAITHRGKGTFVAERKITFEIVQKLDSYEEAVKRGVRVETEVLDFKEITDVPHDVRKNLKITENEAVISLTRLRSFDKIKMFYWTSYLPSSLCRSLLDENFSQVPLFETLKKKLNINVARSERWAEVTRADSFKSELFGISELEPLLYVESITYTDMGITIDYHKGWYRADCGRLYFEVR